jgi:hypothetical protein
MIGTATNRWADRKFSFSPKNPRYRTDAQDENGNI